MDRSGAMEELVSVVGRVILVEDSVDVDKTASTVRTLLVGLIATVRTLLVGLGDIKEGGAVTSLFLNLIGL